jgi:flagellar biogenesis protein FliO
VTGNVGALAIRMIISLGVVLGLMWLAARILSGRNGTRGVLRPAGGRRTGRARPVAAIQVLGRTSINKTASVAVVEACGRTLVLGVSPQGVSVLASDDAPLETGALVSAPMFAGSGPVDSPLLDTGRSLVPTAGRMPTTPGWKPVLDALRERTVRRP